MGQFKEVQSNWMKFNKVGDFIEGTRVGMEMKTGINPFDPKGGEQTQMVYEIKCDSGTFHNLITNEEGNKVVDKKNPTVIEAGEFYLVAKSNIDGAMKKIVDGQKVRLELVEIRPNKDKSRFPFKLVKVFAGEMDKEWKRGMVEVEGTDTIQLDPDKPVF